MTAKTKKRARKRMNRKKLSWQLHRLGDKLKRTAYQIDTLQDETERQGSQMFEFEERLSTVEENVSTTMGSILTQVSELRDVFISVNGKNAAKQSGKPKAANHKK